jgi:CHAD domain-containing protein
VAVGVGLVRARSERERRHASRRRADRRLGLLDDEPVAHGLQRMALAQLDLAIELLTACVSPSGRASPSASSPARSIDATSGSGGAHEQAVHETRKAIKRLRALLRLLRHELGERTFARESDALRRVGRELSTARDAAVMLDTLDALVERHPRALARRRGVVSLRRRVAAERARVQQLTLGDPAARAELLGELHALRWRASAWALPANGDTELVDVGLRRLYEQGRNRHRRLARGKGERTIAAHRWRKRVKDLRYAAEMLDRRDGRHGRRLRKLAARADELGELLGEEHDLAVLAQHLRAGAHIGRHRKRGRRRRKGSPPYPVRSHELQIWRTGKRTRKELLKAIAKRRRKLRKRALREGRRLYAERPKRFVRQVRAS